jgi:hypothetical protein
MRYELAKELCNVGFPQEGRGSWIVDTTSLVARSGERVYAPTLEELIEACGEAFRGLTRDSEGYAAHSHTVSNVFFGETPTEAVARLWLALCPKP